MADLEQIAGALVGIPYKHHGRDPREGLDCFGLFLAVMRGIGKAIPDYAYEENWARKGKNHFLENYWRHAERIEEAQAQAGDAVLMEHVPGVASHIGVMLNHGRMIHCTRVGVVIARLGDPAIRRRLEGFYRINA